MILKSTELPEVIIKYIDSHYGFAIPGSWDIADFIRIWDEYLDEALRNSDIDEDVKKWFDEENDHFLRWAKAVVFDFYHEEGHRASEKDFEKIQLPLFMLEYIERLTKDETNKAEFIKEWYVHIEKGSKEVQSWLKSNTHFLMFLRAFISEEYEAEPTPIYFKEIIDKLQPSCSLLPYCGLNSKALSAKEKVTIDNDLIRTSGPLAPHGKLTLPDYDRSTEVSRELFRMGVISPQLNIVAECNFCSPKPILFDGIKHNENIYRFFSIPEHDDRKLLSEIKKKDKLTNECSEHHFINLKKVKCRYDKAYLEPFKISPEFEVRKL